MENKLSLDEVNSFIARFKSKKKGKNAGKINNVQKEENKTVSANVKEIQTTQVKKEEPVQQLFEEPPKKEEKPIENIQMKHNETKTEDIFGGESEHNVENIFGDSSKDNGEIKDHGTLFESKPITIDTQTPVKKVAPPKFKPPTIPKKTYNYTNFETVQKQDDLTTIEQPKQNEIHNNDILVYHNPSITTSSNPIPTEKAEEIFTEQTQYETTTTIPQSHNPFESAKGDAQVEDLFNSNPIMQATPVIEPKRTFTQPFKQPVPPKNNFSLKKVYNNFSTELKAKTNVFNTDISKEIEQLDEDSSSNVPLDSSEPFTTPCNPTYPIEDNQYQPQPISSYTYLEPSTSSIGGVSMIRNNIVSLYGSKFYMKDQRSLLNEYEMKLYNEYYPNSYSEKYDLDKSIYLLDTIKSYYDNNILSSDISFLNSYLVVFFELLLLKNQMKINASNIFSKQNALIKSNLIDSIKLKLNNSKQNMLSFGINSDMKINENNVSFDISNSTLSNVTMNCFKQNNLTSMLLISLINSKTEINEYIQSFYDNGYLNKNNYFYLLFLVTSGKINNMTSEDADLIFNNFPLFFLILLENFNFNNYNVLKVIIDNLISSQSKYKTLLHYIILKFIKCDFSIENENSYALLFTSFLNHSSIAKIFIADIFNYTLFTLNTNIPTAIAKSSIMLKYKYVIIKQYDNDQNVYSLGEKVNENLSQFGLYSNNIHFREYVNELYPISEDKRIKPSVKKEEIRNDTQNENKSTGSGGLFSIFSSALGIGKGNGNEQQRPLTEEEKAKLTPEERWQLEHPGEEEIYYDKTLKRYVLRGQIYDDQEEVIQKKMKESKPFVPPPKINKPKPAVVVEQQSEPVQSYTASNVMAQPPTTAKVNNPFAVKRMPNAPQRRAPPHANLQNRYAVAYQK